MKSRMLMVAGIIVCVLFVQAPVLALTVTNGDFEDFTGNTHTSGGRYIEVTDWYDGYQWLSWQQTGARIDPSNGTGHVAMGPDGYIYQSLGTYNSAVDGTVLYYGYELNKFVDQSMGSIIVGVDFFAGSFGDAADGVDILGHANQPTLIHSYVTPMSYNDWEGLGNSGPWNVTGNVVNLSGVAHGTEIWMRLGYAGQGATGNGYGPFDNVFVQKHLPKAINVYPVNEAVDIPEDVTFSWNTGQDELGVKDPRITKHYLYVDGPYALGGGDPNFAAITPTVVTDTTDPITSGPVTLAKDSRYYWRVDESLNDSGPTDPNTVVGDIWWFETERTFPIIDSEPQAAFIDLGDDAIFDVSATDPLGGTLHYQWYKGLSGDTTTQVGIDSATLSLTNVQAGDFGPYWCRVSNTTASTDSQDAMLLEKILMAYWTLDGPDPINIPDVTGNGYDGVADSNAVFVSGKISNAVELSGTEVISIGQVIDRPDYFTITGWVNTSVTAYHMILAWTDSTTGTASFLQIESGAGALRYGQWDGVTYQTATSTQTGLNDGTWHHVAATYNAGEVVMYVDGLLSGSTVLTNNAQSAPADLFLIASSIDYFFNGLLDDVRLHSYPLTNTEIADLYLTTEPYVCVGDVPYDANDDCIVNLGDLAIFASHWLECNRYGDVNCPSVVLP